MKKRMLKKGDVLREGYVQGLKKAQNIISKMLRESAGEVGIQEYIDSLPLKEIAKHLLTPQKDNAGKCTGYMVPIDTNSLCEVIEALYEAGCDVTEITAEKLMRIFNNYRYYEDVFDYNALNETDYADDDELREEVDVILWTDPGAMLVSL